MKCSITKKSAARGAPKPLARGAPPPSAFTLQDNADGTFTVLGADAAGNSLDISAVASITALSDNPAVVTVDTPAPMTLGVHAPTAPAPAIGAVANVTVTATWTDGSIGPFTFTFSETITAGPAASILVVPGPVTVH